MLLMEGGRKGGNQKRAKRRSYDSQVRSAGEIKSKNEENRVYKGWSKNNGTVIDRGCSGVLRVQRRHSRRAWIEIRLEMMEHETLWGLLMEVRFRCFTLLHGGYIWVQGKVEPLAGICSRVATSNHDPGLMMVQVSCKERASCPELDQELSGRAVSKILLYVPKPTD
jgi:hypothetical protein